MTKMKKYGNFKKCPKTQKSEVKGFAHENGVSRKDYVTVRYN